MTIYRRHIGRRVLTTVTNGDVISGRLTRATREGIEISEARVQIGANEHELGGALIVPTASIGTVQVEVPNGL